jgi:hypothetical protein
MSLPPWRRRGNSALPCFPAAQARALLPDPVAAGVVDPFKSRRAQTEVFENDVVSVTVLAHCCAQVRHSQDQDGQQQCVHGLNRIGNFDAAPGS